MLSAQKAGPLLYECCHAKIDMGDKPQTQPEVASNRRAGPRAAALGSRFMPPSSAMT